MTLKYIDFSVDMYGTTAISASTYPVVYTGDESSANVRFTVTDEPNLTGATAKVHLYFADSHHIERDLVLEGLVFSYTLVGTENDHAGVVRADIMITLGGATFTRAGYKFRVDTSLEASAPLVEYAVDTLDTLVDTTEDWLLQAQSDFGTAQAQRADEWVTDNDTRDDAFDAAQSSRTITFNESETARTSTFNTNETSRSNTFTTNENARQSAAEANQAQAAIDHSTASADHETAVADSSLASSDHGTAVSDHSAAVTDHSTASADHAAAIADQEIVDGLQDQFDDVIANATVDSEVINARQGSATLGQNILSMKEQLAQTNKSAFEATATQRGKTRGTIVFTDDDGADTVYTRWKPIADEKGIPIVSALITNRVGNAGVLNLTQINEMKASGFEFVSHTHNSISLTNKDTNGVPLVVPLTEEEIRSDLQASKDWLRTNGLTDNIIIYPYGHIDSASSKIVSDYFDLGLYVSGGVNTSPIRTYRLWRQSLELITLQEMKELVDEAVETNGLLVFYTHCWNDTKWLDSLFIDDLKSIIDYIKTTDAEITTLSSAHKRFKNLVESGEFLLDNNRTNVEVIGADGAVYGSHFGSSKFVLFSDFIGDINDINVYADGCTTKIKINSEDVPGLGLPTINGGILETTKSQTTVFQTYKILNTNSYFYRAWNQTNLIWNDWELANSQTKILVADSVNATTLLSGLPLGMSIVFSRTANSVGFPSNLGGQLLTYNNGGSGYSYQEYKPINTTDKYVRYAITDGWSAWDKFAKESAIRQPIATGGYTNATPITSFPLGMTINTVATADATGLPENYAGMLTTWRTPNDSYSKQEYRVHVSNAIYARYISVGVWSAWVKVSAV